MELIKKQKRLIIALSALFIVLIILLITFLLLRKDTPKQPVKEEETPVSFPNTVSFAVPGEIVKDDPIQPIPEGYAEVIQNGIHTGILVKDLSKFKIIFIDYQPCENNNSDINLITGFYDTDLTGSPTFNRRFIAFTLANRKVVGDEKFNEMLNRFNNPDVASGKEYIFQSSCGGGANQAVIAQSVELNHILNNVSTKIYVGGYQYVPSIDEALSFSYTNIQKDNDNIISVSYVIKDSTLLNFNQVLNADSCKDGQNVLIECFASILPNDPANLNKLIDNTRSNINDLLRKDY